MSCVKRININNILQAISKANINVCPKSFSFIETCINTNRVLFPQYIYCKRVGVAPRRRLVSSEQK